MTKDVRDLIAEARELLGGTIRADHESEEARGVISRLVDALEVSLGVPPTCSDHHLVQHRDGRPPWCRACDGGDDE